MSSAADGLAAELPGVTVNEANAAALQSSSTKPLAHMNTYFSWKRNIKHRFMEKKYFIRIEMRPYLCFFRGFYKVKDPLGSAEIKTIPHDHCSQC